MRRRDFIKGVAGSATAWPLAAQAQPSGKLPTIGFLGASFVLLAIDRFLSALVQRLNELG